MPCIIKPDMHHTRLCIMPCCCGGCLLCCVLLSGVLLRVGSVNVAFVRIRLTMSVCLLHGLVLLPCEISSKMTIPSKSLLSLLASCSLFCYAYAAIPTTCFIMPPVLLSQASNAPCPSKPLFGYVTALLSPSYSVVSCRWRWSLFLIGTWRCCSLLEHVYLLGYHNISYLITSIYLEKGGRLGLMPGVLFHSCRLSFCHTGVMFLDFAFLTRLGIYGTPLTVRFE